MSECEHGIPVTLDCMKCEIGSIKNRNDTLLQNSKTKRKAQWIKDYVMNFAPTSGYVYPHVIINLAETLANELEKKGYM